MFDNNFNNSNNDFSFKPIFNQNEKEKVNIPNNNLVNFNETKDMPPELGEIRNLTESPKAQAPTFDVLSPMNVMPLNPINNNDILDSYEKGFDVNQINSLSNNNLNMEKEIQLPNQSSNFNNYTKNQNYDFYNNQQDTKNIVNNEPEFPSFNNEIQSNEYNFINNNLNNQGVSLNYDFYNNETDKNIINNVQNSEYSIINNSLNIDNNNEEDNKNDISFESTKTEPVISERISMQENNYSFDKEIPVEEDIDYKTYYTNIFIPEKDEKTSVSDVINYENNESSVSEKDELLELGINDIYSEPDTLEIIDMDIEEESMVENETISYNDAILQIKDLCERLKEKDIKLSLEEFDFEDMYQLIIKINK